MLALFAKGLAIGLVFGVPVGAIGALAVERTLSFGAGAGLATGMACACVDLAYAAVGAAGASAVYGFIEGHAQPIGVVGGAAVAALGVVMLSRSRPGGDSGQAGSGEATLGLSACFWSSFALAASNPSTILLFLVAFSLFEVGPIEGPAQGAALVLGVFAGASVWWLVLVGAVSRLGGRISPRARSFVIRACAMAVILLGAAFALRALIWPSG